MITEEHHIEHIEEPETTADVAETVAEAVADAHGEALATLREINAQLCNRVDALERRLDEAHRVAVESSHHDADRVAEVLNTATVADAISDHHDPEPVAAVPAETVTEIVDGAEEAEKAAEATVEKAEKKTPARKHRLYGKR